MHIGVEEDFRPARKAHPGFVVDLPTLTAALIRAGYRTWSDEPLDGYDRIYVDDPFGRAGVRRRDRKAWFALAFALTSAL